MLLVELLKKKNMSYDIDNNDPVNYFDRILKKLDIMEYLEECVYISRNISKLNISKIRTDDISPLARGKQE